MVGLAAAFKRQLELIHHNREVENPDTSKSDPVLGGADRDVIVLWASWCYRTLSVQGVIFNTGMELAMELSPFIALKYMEGGRQSHKNLSCIKIQLGL
jgi:hypothetical protein